MDGLDDDEDYEDIDDDEDVMMMYVEFFASPP